MTTETKKIMVVDDEPTIRNILYRLLDQAGYKIITAPGGEMALDTLKKDRPDLIILDQKMPGLDGLATLKKIRTFDKNIAVVMLTGHVTEELKSSAQRLGVDDFLNKGQIPVNLFLKSIENVLRRKKAVARKSSVPGGRIMVVDDEDGVRKMLGSFLKRHNYEVREASSGEEALEILRSRSYRPDVILLDIQMPGLDGLATLKEIKKIDQDIGVVIMTGAKDKGLGLQAMEAGSYEYIMKPFDLDYFELVILSKILIS